MQCSKGHQFPAQLSLTKCPGCQSSILAARMVNCPFCNEPITKLEIRLDHLSSGMTINPLCKGVPTLAEVTQITLEMKPEERIPTQS
jgi:hypothetical protein